MAPEIHAKHYDTQVDLWAVGVITYIMLSGYQPFQSENAHELIKKIKTGEFHLKHPGFLNVSLESKIFLSKLISVNPKKRMTAVEALKSEWMKEEPDLSKMPVDDSEKEIMEPLATFQMKSKL